MVCWKFVGLICPLCVFMPINVNLPSQIELQEILIFCDARIADLDRCCDSPGVTVGCWGLWCSSVNNADSMMLPK